MTKVRILTIALVGFLASACQTTGDVVRIDNVPMYAQPKVERPEFLKKADRAFIEDAMAAMRKNAGTTTRREASRVWYLEGERFLEGRNIDYAMRRYNQAWLLDPENFQPYWGFGRAMLAQDKLDMAIENFERALALLDSPRHKIALSVDTATAYSVRGKHDASFAGQDFARANKLFSDSMKADPKQPNVYRRWAMALYREGRYADAWAKVAEARRRNSRPFPPGFLAALSKRMQEPR